MISDQSYVSSKFFFSFQPFSFRKEGVFLHFGEPAVRSFACPLDFFHSPPFSPQKWRQPCPLPLFKSPVTQSNVETL